MGRPAGGSAPRPFYQDLYAATIHHGFTAAGNRTHFCAYYPALRRLVELMREVKNANEATPQADERAVSGRSKLNQAATLTRDQVNKEA